MTLMPRGTQLEEMCWCLPVVRAHRFAHAVAQWRLCAGNQGVVVFVQLQHSALSLKGL